jgi:site-specific DNA-cytosine methylase
LLLKTLVSLNYSYVQFLLTPIQFQIPNQRSRYFLLARRGAPFTGLPTLPSGDSPNHCADLILHYIPFNQHFTAESSIFSLIPRTVIPTAPVTNEGVDAESDRVLSSSSPTTAAADEANTNSKSWLLSCADDRYETEKLQVYSNNGFSYAMCSYWIVFVL